MSVVDGQEALLLTNFNGFRLMPPTLSTSWDDSASSVEIDDYGDVFCTTLSSFDAFWSPVGLFWLPGDAEYKGLGAG